MTSGRVAGDGGGVGAEGLEPHLALHAEAAGDGADAGEAGGVRHVRLAERGLDDGEIAGADREEAAAEGHAPVAALGRGESRVGAAAGAPARWRPRRRRRGGRGLETAAETAAFRRVVEDVAERDEGLDRRPSPIRSRGA